MDSESLLSGIHSAYPSDPATAAHLPSPTNPQWSLQDDGLLRLDDCIYVPNVGDLHLRVLQLKHNHPLSGHFRQNKTLELVRRDFVWPEMCSFIKDYCNSCTVCKHSKTPRHKLYRLLKQLPIPLHPWESISMDLIEQLPISNG